MGKFKHCMRSLRDRLSPPKSMTSNCSSPSSTLGSRSSSVDTNIHGGSSTTILTSATSYSLILIPSPTPTFYRRPMAEAMSSAPAAFSLEERNAGRQRISLNAHATLKFNIALLEFAKKLPLEELRMLGHAPALPHFSNYAHTQNEHEGAPDDIATQPSARSETLTLASMISDSSSSCAWNKLQRAGRDQIQRQCRDAETMVEDEARTLSLDSTGSDWTWSFAGFSGWHIGGDHAQSQRDDGDSARVGTEDISSPPTAHFRCAPCFTLRSADSYELFLESIGLPIPNESFREINDEVFDELPNWSDVENDTEYNYFERKSFQWSAMASTASSSSSKSLSQIQKVAIFEPMSDEGFEALPDWEDVEDDPEYDKFFEEQFHWSTTNSSCSSNLSMQELPMAFPKLYAPSGYFSTATRTSGDVTKMGSAASQLKDGDQKDIHVAGKA